MYRLHQNIYSWVELFIWQKLKGGATSQEEVRVIKGKKNKSLTKRRRVILP
jgi:hypothetical protein